MKNKVRPVYSELQGYLSQAPSSGGFKIGNVRTLINKAICDLNIITSYDYNRYLIQIEECYGSPAKEYLDTSVYKGKLGGLIARLHGEYFSDEQAPFSGMPSTVINATQTQTQNIDIQMLLNIQSKIDEKLNQFAEGSKEKTFLQRLKGSLSGIKDVTQLFISLIAIAKELGISVDELSNIFVK